MSSMQAYLAEKYMSGVKAEAILARVAPEKKKKRKGVATSTTSIVRDEDAGWGDEGREEEDISEAVIAPDRGFKKRKAASNWTRITSEGIKERSPTPPPADDEKPVVVEDPASTSQARFTGGLMTSEQLRRTRSKAPTLQISNDEMTAAQETVYRDASGRRIDTKAERAEAARKKREREEQEAQKMEWGKGLVQREQEERRKQDLEKAKRTQFTRHADDEELNEELKAQERWNDPAAAFLTKKKSKGPRRPEYTGPPPPPNRFGINPGYRWDGVDRSNGFEKKYFQRLNERNRKKYESHVWSVEDM